MLKTFGIKDTAQGMVHTLPRLGHSYKKATVVPGKLEPEKQASFVKMYERRYKHLKEGEKVYFIDGSQPTYNSHAGYGWIATGQQFGLKSHDGRKRVTLLGAYDPKSGEVIAGEYGTLNQESVIDFLYRLKAKNMGKKLNIIWDTVSYQHGKKVVEAAKVLGIRIVDLPPSSTQN